MAKEMTNEEKAQYDTAVAGELAAWDRFAELIKEFIALRDEERAVVISETLKPQKKTS